jgi:hypothetical protein
MGEIGREHCIALIGAALRCDAVISKVFVACELRCVGFVLDSVTGVRFKEPERVS